MSTHQSLLGNCSLKRYLGANRGIRSSIIYEDINLVNLMERERKRGSGRRRWRKGGPSWLKQREIAVAGTLRNLFAKGSVVQWVKSEYRHWSQRALVQISLLFTSDMTLGKLLALSFSMSKNDLGVFCMITK